MNTHAATVADVNSYFKVIEPKAMSPDKHFRIYPCERELIGVWTGSGGELNALNAQAGLAGYLLHLLMSSKAKKAAQKLAVLETKSLAELRDDPDNFVITENELEKAEIGPVAFSTRFKYNAQIARAGLLKLNVPGKKPRVFGFFSKEDMTKALELIPASLGQKLDVQVVWDSRRQKYRKR